MVEPTELERALRHGPFSRALRAAIATRAVPLDRLSRKLAERGVQISPSTLSQWQRGKASPKHDESMTAVRLLERVLSLPGGSLLGLLSRTGALPDSQLWTDPERLATVLDDIDTSNAGRLVRLSVHDHYEVDADRKERSGWTRSVFRAVDDGVDRLVVVFRTEDGPVPVIGEVRFCSLGRVRRDPGSGFLAAEMLFDRPLTTGETTIVEFRTVFEDDAPPARNFDRRFGHPVGQYVLQVSFDPEVLPKRCFSYRRDAVDAPDREETELTLGASASVHLVAHNVTHGICGIEVEWD